MSRFYVTTPIYYVNDVPHLGTAYTTIAADALRRAHQLFGDATFLLTGTDEHGLKIERQALEKGMEPLAFADQASASFRAAWPELRVEPDYFIRTTEPAHKAFVQDLWRRIEAAGDLYEGSYEDWYCVGCESFKTEKELEQPGNLCPLHKKAVERVKEQTYFFRLSRWEKPLLELYERRPDFVRPESRRNEVVSFVSSGLRDLSVSRTSFSWGIPVPGDEKHVMYVWFDALTNYRSALAAAGKDGFWPRAGSDARVLHLMGKDILRFHAVYWPAFLLAAGYSQDELPSQIFAHGFLTVDGQKMSKSLRNAVDPLRLARKLGPDVLRYQLLRSVAFGQDGDFDHAGMLERYNADLGKNIGNLLQRTLGLCSRFTGSKRPDLPSLVGIEPLTRRLITNLEESVNLKLEASRQAWENMEVHRAMELAMAMGDDANGFVNDAAPWAAAKAGDMTRVEAVLAALLEVLRILSILLWPAMPGKADELRQQLGLGPISPCEGEARWPSRFEPLQGGGELSPGTPLFPMYDKDQVKALLDELVPPREEAPSPEVKAPTPVAGAPAEELAPIPFEDFARVELKVGVVLSCERVPRKDKLLRLQVDLGEEAPRPIVAGLALSFTPESLVGRRVVVVSNLEPRSFGKGLVSHGMLLATGAPESLTLASVDGDVAPGARLK